MKISFELYNNNNKLHVFALFYNIIVCNFFMLILVYFKAQNLLTNLYRILKKL